MDSLCIVVPKKKAEPIRRKLLERGILRKDLQIRSDSRNVYLPVIQRIDLGYPVESSEFREVEELVTDYRVLVDVPDELRPLLPSSFDTLGSVALVKMADEIAPYAKDIGKAILAAQKSIRTVCMDSGVVDEFRTRNIKVVAGDKTTETTHKEYGLVFRLDVAKVFFSPRLATERDIVSRQVQQGEAVVDMFAGIGPFSIMIARSRAPRVVYAIDMNPVAIEFMKQNIQLNKVEGIRPILGDAGEEIGKLEKADRIIMNLPHEASSYLPDALKALRPGGIIHYYEIMEDSKVMERLDGIATLARREGRVLKELARRKVKSYSPTMTFYGFDLQFF
ncbi:MAG: class I SAM-dependent methyltransferase family protein [Candidatus Thermoplasmatota archaeon]|nr:class I SAM-dependent methyltransferase family protein [Candidatus Thermoplasmatota archaeon]